MKAGDLHEFIFLLVRHARLDSLHQGVGLEGRDADFKAECKTARTSEKDPSML